MLVLQDSEGCLYITGTRGYILISVKLRLLGDPVKQIKEGGQSLKLALALH